MLQENFLQEKFQSYFGHGVTALHILKLGDKCDECTMYIQTDGRTQGQTQSNW